MDAEESFHFKRIHQSGNPSKNASCRKLGSQSKVLMGHQLTQSIIARMDFSASYNSTSLLLYKDINIFIKIAVQFYVAFFKCDQKLHILLFLPLKKTKKLHYYEKKSIITAKILIISIFCFYSTDCNIFKISKKQLYS